MNLINFVFLQATFFMLKNIYASKNLEAFMATVRKSDFVTVIPRIHTEIFIKPRGLKVLSLLVIIGKQV